MVLSARVQEQEQRQARQQKQALNKSAGAVSSPSRAGQRRPSGVPVAQSESSSHDDVLVKLRKSGSAPHVEQQPSNGQQALPQSGCDTSAAKHSEPCSTEQSAGSPGLEAQLRSGACGRNAVKGSPGSKLRGMGSDGASLIDSAEDLEHLLGQLVGRAEGLHGSARAMAT